jgi:hypothetical protein
VSLKTLRGLGFYEGLLAQYVLKFGAVLLHIVSAAVISGSRVR